MINITQNNTIVWCWAVSHYRINLALRQGRRMDMVNTQEHAMSVFTTSIFAATIFMV